MSSACASDMTAASAAPASGSEGGGASPSSVLYTFPSGGLSERLVAPRYPLLGPTPLRLPTPFAVEGWSQAAPSRGETGRWISGIRSRDSVSQVTVDWPVSQHHGPRSAGSVTQPQRPGARAG